MLYTCIEFGMYWAFTHLNVFSLDHVCGGHSLLLHEIITLESSSYFPLNTVVSKIRLFLLTQEKKILLLNHKEAKINA